MDQIPNELIGRVDSLFRSAGLLIRIALLALFTGMVSNGLIMSCFIVLSVILIISSVLILASWKKGLTSDIIGVNKIEVEVTT
jgi:hypothetical protein